jgi:membrane protein
VVAHTPTDGVLQGVAVRLLGEAGSGLPWFWQAVTRLTAVGLLLLTFVLVYRLLPSVPIRWREALLAGAMATLLWSLAKLAFTWYIDNVATVNRFYGSLGGVIVVVLWGFYSALVMLFCAEVAANVGRAFSREPET